MGDGNVGESRPYEILSEHTAVGRSSVTMLCPWCDREVTAYTWSLAGSGKRCECGAKFTWYPKACEAPPHEAAVPQP